MLTGTGKICSVCYDIFVECKITTWRPCENFLQVSVLMAVGSGVARGGGGTSGATSPLAVSKRRQIECLKKLSALKRFSFF
jgi:hypothetical protein